MTLQVHNNGMSGLGALQPGDSCYDPNRPWWGYTDAECACMAAENRPIGQQCASFSGVLATMAGQTGTVVGSGVDAAVSSTVGGMSLGTIAVLAAVGLLIFAIKK